MIKAWFWTKIPYNRHFNKVKLSVAIEFYATVKIIFISIKAVSSSMMEETRVP